MDYNTYSYIFPPRPENKISPDAINRYDDGKYFGQPKYNGSNCIVFMDDKGFFKVLNRRNEAFSASNLKPNVIDFKSLYRGTGFMVLCGELLSKAANGEDQKLFNQKFIIWDIIVLNGKHLTNSTFESRVALLDELYPPVKKQNFEHLIDIGSTSVFRTPTYKTGFEKIFKELVKTDLYEGFVMKRRDGKLEYGWTGKNNWGWQVKCRKATNNYRY